METQWEKMLRLGQTANLLLGVRLQCKYLLILSFDGKCGPLFLCTVLKVQTVLMGSLAEL